MNAAPAIAQVLPLKTADEITAGIRSALHDLPEPFASDPAQLRQRDAMNAALVSISHLRAWVDAASRLITAQTEIIKASDLMSQVQADRADSAEETIAVAIDGVLDLLNGVDGRQQGYRPKTHAEVVEAVHDLLATLLDSDEVVEVVVRSPEMASDVAELGVPQ